MRKIAALLLGLCVASMATVNFPYPQAHTYGNNTIISTYWNCAGETASSVLKKAFLAYLNTYYEESGDQARIKFDESQYTVSEGIGYGMIMMVYFSDNTTSYESQFNKLWNYYKKHTNGNGVMNWKIQGFNGGCEGCNGATDADEDVAFALAMAYYQFGGNVYKEGATNLIGKIRQSEFSGNGMHKLGDAWDSYKNPSYVSPAAYEVFKLFDTGNSSFWGSAISKNYELLLANQNQSTGIPSGWANNNYPYNAVTGNNGYGFAGYDYDATRAPWRWAWSYAWYGHSQASTLLNKLASWVSTKTTGQLYINMNQDGTINTNGAPCTTNGCKANGSSIGSLSAPLIYSSQYQEKLNTNYVSLMSQQTGYYHSSLRLLTGLLMSGNMQNFSASGYKSQPFTFTMTAEQEESCNTETEYYENSGAYGWNSTSVVLSDESETGVHMGALIKGTERVAAKVLNELQAGEKYTLSFNILQDVNATSLRMKINLYPSEARVSGSDYCGVSYKMESGVSVPYTCEFTATESSAPELVLSINNWNEPGVTISDLSLKNASGQEIIEPGSSSSEDAIVWQPTLNLQVQLQGRTLSLAGVEGEIALNIMDLQGRVMLTKRVRSGQVDLSNLRSGSYVLRATARGAVVNQRINLK